MPELKDPGKIVFSAVIQNGSGGGAWVDFPYNLKETFGKGNLVPIKARFDNKADYSGNLAMMGGECAMLLVRKDIREQIDKQAGQSVNVEVWLDTSERKVNVSKDIQDAFKKAGVWEKFTLYSYSHQNEHIRYIEEAKRAETRSQRIHKSIELIKQK